MRRNIPEIYETAKSLGILMHRESNAQRKQRLQMLWILRAGECQTHASREPTVLRAPQQPGALAFHLRASGS
ncbi:TPA: hypothetical protein EYN23_05035 [Candidatus Poribacteria bacterium]|nr:hypothetical protein [Candidatus Poribacteria bacterium]